MMMTEMDIETSVYNVHLTRLIAREDFIKLRFSAISNIHHVKEYREPGGEVSHIINLGPGERTPDTLWIRNHVNPIAGLHAVGVKKGAGTKAPAGIRTPADQPVTHRFTD
jgi:hypothetical protein